ncbi:Hypothetical predicted protein [Prunus dulcis]|uniref:Uncharacterized protein n=1 Tax=Prunus dulcis TaxID=3755 RepID=A0A5E4GAE3_PRUDU|nr:Hypothetical predicted protein [Prunus dulcis]
MLTSRYVLDTVPIRSQYGIDTSGSQYGIDTSGGKNENIYRLWGTEAKQKRRKKKKKKKKKKEKEPSLVPSAAVEGAVARTQQAAKEGETHMWDVGGDAFDSMDLENARVLEIANLSLDESNLEGIIFTHDE